jgi:hypothetical protein
VLIAGQPSGALQAAVLAVGLMLASSIPSVAGEVSEPTPVTALHLGSA